MRLLVILFIFSTSVFSQSIGFEDAANPELISDTRAQALGGAFMCKADDSLAAFYNPAGLGSIRKGSFVFAHGQMEGNKAYFDTAGDNGAGSIFPRMVAQQTPEGMFEQIQGQVDKVHHSRLNLFPNMAFRNLTLGWMFSQRSRALIPSATDPVELAFRRDFGPVVGLNFSAWGGIFKLGISSVLLSRKQYQGTAPQSTLPISIAEADYNTGRMVHSTIGFRVTLPVWAMMSFSGVIRNAFEAEFTNSYGDGASLPENIPRTYDYGLSFTPLAGATTRVHIEFSYKDVTNVYDTVDKRRKMGMGIEIDLARRIFVRFGSGDGFGSFGLGFGGDSTRFDITTYAVDTSSEPEVFRGSEDRRFSSKLTMGF